MSKLLELAGLTRFSPDKSKVQFGIRVYTEGCRDYYEYNCHFVYRDGSVSKSQLRYIFTYGVSALNPIVEDEIWTETKNGQLPVKLKVFFPFSSEDDEDWIY